MNPSADRIAWALFAILLAMCLVLVVAFLLGERPYEDVETAGVTERVYRGHGFDHPNPLHR